MLDNDVDVTLLSIQTPKHPYDLNHLPDEIKSKIKFHQVFVNTSHSIVTLFKSFFSANAYTTQRFFNEKVRAQLKTILSQNSFDIIQLEGLYLFPYVSFIKSLSKAKIAFRSHNVEFEIWNRMQLKSNGLKKMIFKWNAAQLKKEEQQAKAFDFVIPISSKDAKFYQSFLPKQKIHTVPFGVNPEEYAGNNEDQSTKHNQIGFIGALDWLPNQEGLLWFLNEAWPQVNQALPKVKLMVAGRNFPESIKQLKYPNVEMLGEVENAADFIQSNTIMIVPLLSGSGIRIKLIEQMMLKMPIVTTTVAAEGIDYINGRHLLIANDPIKFAENIISCLNNSTFAEGLGNSAAELIKKKHNNEKLIKDLLMFYQK